MHQPNQRLKTRSTITCCNGCVPPKRHTACWGNCPEYLKQKAEYEAKKAKRYRDDDITGAIATDRRKKARKAMKKRS